MRFRIFIKQAHAADCTCGVAKQNEAGSAGDGDSWLMTTLKVHINQAVSAVSACPTYTVPESHILQSRHLLASTQSGRSLPDQQSALPTRRDVLLHHATLLLLTHLRCLGLLHLWLCLLHASECAVEPAAHQAALALHLSVALASLLVAFAAAFVGHEVAEEGAGVGGLRLAISTASQLRI